MYRRALASFALIGVSLVLTGCPTGTTTPSAAPAKKASVSGGSNVAVSVAPDPATGVKAMSVTFGNVSAPGDITLDTATNAPPLPAGAVAVGGVIFDITTSAKFDKATVCFENDKFTAQTKLLHYVNSAWKDETSTVAPPKVCGDFTSFSPVAAVEGAATPTPTATATATAAATATASATASASATPTEAPSPTPSVAATTAPPTTPPTTTAPATTAPPTTAPPTTAPPTPTPTPVPTQAGGYPGYLFAPNASGAVPPGFTRYGATVTDAATGAPVVDACVYTGPPSGCPLKGANHTDANGFFAVDLPSGSQFAFNIQSDPQNAVYNAVLQKTLAAGTSNSVAMTHK